MATTSSMFMYALTIQPSSSISQAILGQFAGTKEQQIVTGSGSRLTMLRPDAQQGKVSTILSQDVFGIIRTLAAFRLAGSNKGMIRHLSLLVSHSDCSKHEASQSCWAVSGSPTLYYSERKSFAGNNAKKASRLHYSRL